VLWALRSVPFGNTAATAIGIFVRAALPRAVRVAEIDVQARVDLQPCMLRHLRPLIPGQRPSELLRQAGDRAVMLSRTASAPCPASAGPFFTRASTPCSAIRGKCSSIVNRVVRSTSVPIAELSNPRMRSPSQWPGTTRSATSAGRSLIMISGTMNDLPRPRVRARGTRNARQCADRRSARGAEPTALHVKRLVNGFVADAHRLIVREVEP